MRFAAAKLTSAVLAEAGLALERCSAEALAQAMLRQLGASADYDWGVLFFTLHFRRHVPALSRALNIPVLIGCSAEGVIATEEEVEQQPGMTLFAARTPGVEATPFRLSATSAVEWSALLRDAASFRSEVGVLSPPRAFLLLAEPFSVPLSGKPGSLTLLDAFNRHYPGVPVVGGVASSAPWPGGNVLLLNDEVMLEGAVGIALSGRLEVDVVVSQGCRPIGRPFRVTRAHQNFILSLDDRPPLDQLEQVVESLDEADQSQLHGRLFIGRAVRSHDEPPYASAFGRGDFVIRGILGGDPTTGALAIGDLPEVGQVVQFHLRDAKTAREDLELQLAPHSLFDPPGGALLFSCNGRGTRLYGAPNGDIQIVQAALGDPSPVPLAGFFCAGEIGPIGGQNFLHGHTASIILFREPRA